MKNREIDEEKKQLAHKVFKTVPYINLLGLELVDISVGEAILRLRMHDQLRQPHGVLHGGATASLIDTATAFAVISHLADGEKASTVDLTIHYMRPVLEGEIICTARVLRAGKRLLTVSADVINNEEKLIATALSTYSKI